LSSIFQLCLISVYNLYISFAAVGHILYFDEKLLSAVVVYDIKMQQMFYNVNVFFMYLQGHPKHMTAFFCVKLFEICTTGMAMLSYFSSTQELRRWIAAQVSYRVL